MTLFGRRKERNVDVNEEDLAAALSDCFGDLAFSRQIAKQVKKTIFDYAQPILAKEREGQPLDPTEKAVLKSLRGQKPTADQAVLVAEAMSRLASKSRSGTEVSDLGQ
jgi:hypothetical protein